jgi:hypothetical protein
MRSLPFPFLAAGGRGRCKQCGSMLFKRGLYWCSDACEDYWVDDSI